ncbi:MAG: carboxylating nicotinate-nucleotide diphosphorylase [Pararhizobium sp.]
MNRVQTAPPALPPLMFEDTVRQALREDLGRAGDITSAATIAPDARATAVLASRSDGVVAGLPLAAMAFRLLDAGVVVEMAISDGARIAPGTVLAEISGPARAVLSGERVALNFLMHLSGVATETARYVEAIGGSAAKVCCTRKTIPGLRALQKYAVLCGGGSNHRFGLDDAVLIKDNHIAVAGSVAGAIRAARAHVGHLVVVEVEVDTLAQLEEALTAKPDVILLDNMNAETLEQAVKITGGRARLEASGNVSLETIVAIARTGVDYISTSRITMAAGPLDIGLDIDIA